ncbi:MAG: class I SAM-dependent methyltransferase [Methanolinea sp.]|jgi:O-methyltransferase involved in polyketide biosynthesis
MEYRIADVPATALVTLYCHALESQSEDPVLDDPKAVEITTELNRILSQSKNHLDRMLVSGKIDRNLVIHIALRARHYDEYAGEFLARHPGGVIVNIGCGLDSRFLRIDNGSVIFYDLDLPEMIDLKKRFF